MRGGVLCLVAVLLAGCTTRQKIAGGGAALAVVGLGLSFSNEDDESMGTAGKIGIGCMLGGLAVLFVAAAIEETEASAKPKSKEVTLAKRPPELAPTSGVSAAQKRRDEAKALTQQAQEAAAAGDCARVQALSVQVGAIDRLYYGAVFMADPAVQKCFQPPAPDAVPPPILPPPAAVPTS